MAENGGPPTSLDDWETVYENPWWKMVKKDDWHALTSSNGRSCAVILVVDENHDVVLVENPRIAIGSVCLELPRGGIDAGETPEAAAARECFEETGVLITASDLIPLGIVYPDSGILNHQAYLFCAQINGRFMNLKAEDPDEICGHKVMSLASLRGMIADGQIRDGFTIAAERKLSLMMERGLVEIDGLAGQGSFSDIEILDENKDVVTEIRTDDPEFTFDQYCRNRESTGWSWRVART